MEDPLILTFVDEATRNLAQVEALLRDMDNGLSKADLTAITSCYRALHTISGLAGYLSLSRIATVVLNAERVLEEMRLNPLLRHDGKITALLCTIAHVRVLVLALQAGDQSPTSQVLTVVDKEVIDQLRVWGAGAHCCPQRIFPPTSNQRPPSRYWQYKQRPTGPPPGEIISRTTSL
jgi:chemotaxis protein histidine kinase CheA